MFAIWHHYSYLPNSATIAYIALYCCKRLKSFPGMQVRKWNHFTDSKVNGPLPTTWDSPLSKMSCCRLPAHRSHISWASSGPRHFWESWWQLFCLHHEEASPETVLCHPALSSISQPTTHCPNLRTDQPMVDIEHLTQPPPSCLSRSFSMEYPSHNPCRPGNSELPVISSSEDLWNWNSFQIFSFIL